MAFEIIQTTRYVINDKVIVRTGGIIFVPEAILHQFLRFPALVTILADKDEQKLGFIFHEKVSPRKPGMRSVSEVGGGINFSATAGLKTVKFNTNEATRAYFDYAKVEKMLVIDLKCPVQPF